MEKKVGYTCPCGTFHEAGLWGAAHWGELLTHTCECGRVNSIVRGRVMKTKKPPKVKP